MQAESSKVVLAENWKWIKNYKGKYKISNLGRVKSVPRAIMVSGGGTRISSPRYLKPAVCPSGHLYVCLCKNTVKHNHYIHRLVLEAFIGPCPDGMECRHFPDRDPTNNRLDNIQWGSRLCNSKDKEIHGTKNNGENNKVAKLTRKDVITIRKLRATGIPVHRISRLYPQVKYRAVLNASIGKTWSHLTSSVE